MPPSNLPVPAGSVIALAGRRPDAPGAAQRRFPASEIPRVRSELEALLRPGVRALVCSAASGADLLALDVAGAAGIERHVMLPFDEETFRATSVEDRPGDWGGLYRRILADLHRYGSVESGTGDPDDPTVYFHTNERIIGRALELASRPGGTLPRVGVVVWEGAPRGGDDATDDFRRRADAEGFSVRHVLTR